MCDARLQFDYERGERSEKKKTIRYDRMTRTTNVVNWSNNQDDLFKTSPDSRLQTPLLLLLPIPFRHWGGGGDQEHAALDPSQDGTV